MKYGGQFSIKLKGHSWFLKYEQRILDSEENNLANRCSIFQGVQ